MNSTSPFRDEAHVVVPSPFDGVNPRSTAEIQMKSTNITAMHGKESGFESWYFGVCACGCWVYMSDRPFCIQA
jgi:hypothetical protein